MDKLRIEKVKSIKERLDAIFDELSELQKAEQEDYNKMPKWQKDSDDGYEVYLNCDELDDAVYNVNTAIDILKDINYYYEYGR